MLGQDEINSRLTQYIQDVLWQKEMTIAKLQIELEMMREENIELKRKLEDSLNLKK